MKVTTATKIMIVLVFGNTVEIMIVFGFGITSPLLL